MLIFGRRLLAIVILLLLIFSSFNIVFAKSGNENTSLLNDKINDFVDNISEDIKMKFIMRLGKFPSVSACVIKNNSIVWYEGYGKAHILPNKEPTADTIYPVGSISKTVTATAAMQLCEKGYFDLDDDINNYLDFNVRNPDYPDVPITFRMLLSHHSSISGIHELNYWYLTYLFFLHKRDYPYPLIEQLITPDGKFYKNLMWKDFPPGTKKGYSNFNYILLEEIIEEITGQHFNEYCKEHIFEPLEMYNTSFYYSELRDKELAGAYHNLGNFYFPIPYLDIGYSYGGLKTSVEDLSHYLLAYLNEGEYKGYRLLNESTINTMLTIQYNDDNNYSRYCLGWQYFGGFTGSSTFGHTGHAPGGAAGIFMNTTNDYAQIFFINRYLTFKGIMELFSWFMLITFLNDKIKEY